MAKTMVVIGATRGTGTLAVEQLLSQGHSVRVVARNLEKARRLFGTRVELEHTDLSKPDVKLEQAMAGADGVIFTAGIPPGFASEAMLKATDHGGLVAAVRAAERAKLTGRFVYMTTMGVHRQTWLTRTLDVVKWNLLRWRRAAEEALLSSTLDGAVVRAGLLTNGASTALDLAAFDRPVTLSSRVSRKEVARVLVATAQLARGPRDLSVFGTSGPPTSDAELVSRLKALG